MVYPVEQIRPSGLTFPGRASGSAHAMLFRRLIVSESKLVFTAPLAGNWFRLRSADEGFPICDVKGILNGG